ncbi:MAG: PTS system mannose/fructose/sorbose family IID [Erysipelotrichaceae bacterium]|nr:MAG: PTS system mannose/fructose/sorbose family IID [Erysipelotrichaceae bacterium]
MSNSIFTKRELRAINIRHIWGLQLGWNYERMQALGYLYAIYPALKKIYKNDPEALQKSCETHLQFYNTNPSMSEIIIGMDIAIEEREGAKSIETVAPLKVALMGPFAGIGDTIFALIAATIFGAIAGNMAVEGNAAGMWMWIAWNFVVIFIRTRLFDLGYSSGIRIVTDLKDQFAYITNAASILGLVVVGGLIPTVVKFKIPYVFVSGEVKLSVQDNLDKIMPFLPQVVLMIGVYWLVKRKMSISKLIGIVMLGAIVLTYFKVIA